MGQGCIGSMSGGGRPVRKLANTVDQKQGGLNYNDDCRGSPEYQNECSVSICGKKGKTGGREGGRKEKKRAGS